VPYAATDRWGYPRATGTHQMSRRPPPEAALPAPRRKLGVVLVDPLPVVRAGLALLIDERPDMEVLAEAGSAVEGVDLLSRVRRSRIVVLVGLGLEGDHDASWLIRTIRERFPTHALLAMGANADPTTVSRALFVGADGYVDKNCDPAEFLVAIRKVADREMVLQGPVASAVGAVADGIELRRDIDLRLTGREREVLAIAAEGLTARQIATRLGVRERTVTTHLARIYGKLGVGNRLAAVRMAARSGLVSVGAPE
jgi:DNA-binding NarL/FixJ family response regulator